MTTLLPITQRAVKQVSDQIFPTSNTLTANIIFTPMTHTGKGITVRQAKMKRRPRVESCVDQLNDRVRIIAIKY